MIKILFKITLFRNDAATWVHTICEGEANAELPFLPASGMKIGKFTVSSVGTKNNLFEVRLCGIEDPTLPEPLGYSLSGLPEIKYYPHNRYESIEQMMDEVRNNFLPDLNWNFIGEVK